MRLWILTFLPLPDCRKGVGTKGLVNRKCEGTRSRDLCKVPRWVGPKEGEAEGQLVLQDHGSRSEKTPWRIWQNPQLIAGH